MLYLIIFTFILLLISFIKDKNKTIKALRIAVNKFIKISIPLLSVVILVSLVLVLVSEEMMTRYLSHGKGIISLVIASLLGSITMMPGFIAFPLSGILKQNGVPYMVISAFTTTLMMVGIVTFPIEKKYFGTKVALVRNSMSFGIAIIIALATGILFGEIF